MAQIGLSYTYNGFNEKADDYVTALACVAQCAIDNSKRSFDIDIHSEIQRMKQELNIKSIGYPAFFAGIRPDLRSKVNPNIVCPMNCVYNMKNKVIRTKDIIPNKEFFITHENKPGWKKSRKIEKLIEDFSLEAYKIHIDDDASASDYFLLRCDYDELIDTLRHLTLSGNYLGLTSWLINRALCITPNMQIKQDKAYTKLTKNRPLLMKILYDMNPKNFKKCFKNDSTMAEINMTDV